MQSTLQDVCDKCDKPCTGKLYGNEVLCDECYAKAVTYHEECAKEE
jgi:hypothetical protein